MSSPDWLGPAARRSAREAWMLGHAFGRYRELEGLSEEQLSEELGCTLDVLHWLSLCRRPEGQAFNEQVSAIARRFEVDPIRLSGVLRHVEVMEALSAKSRDGEVMGEDSLLLAARDRTHDEEKDS